MAKVSLIIDKRNGGVLLRVANNQREARIATGITGDVSKWNGTKFVGGAPMINAQIAECLRNAKSALLAVRSERDVSTLTAQQLRDIIAVKMRQRGNTSPLFLSYFRNHVANIVKPSTRQIYTSTLHRVEQFAGGEGEVLTFDDITPQWLSGFSRWLLSHGSPAVNGRGIHLRNIRAVVNAAITDEITTVYAFRRFKIPTAETPSRALSLFQLVAFLSAPLTGMAGDARDIFAFSFYLAGINLADIFTLTPANITGGRLRYQRHKTSKFYDIPLTPSVVDIITRHKGTAKLLDICERYSNAHTFTIAVNRGLHSHGVAGVPPLTSYFARHSWATIAVNDCGVGLDIVARALGHSHGYKVTQIYARYNTTAVDNAVRAVEQKTRREFHN